MIIKKTKLGIILLIATLSAGCAPSLALLDAFIRGQGFIPYTSPLQNAGPGTMIGGNPQEQTFVAAPETCFPEKLADGTLTNLRDSFPVDLPTESQSAQVSGALSVQLTNLAIKTTGVLSVSANANFKDLKEVDLEIGNASIDFMNLVDLQTYYQNNMPTLCKQYLNISGFVLQALKVDQLSFTFINNSGGAIDISATFVATAGVNTQWQVQGKTKLVISTPMYLGFQLGSLRQEAQGFMLYRAADVVLGNYDFKPLSPF